MHKYKYIYFYIYIYIYIYIYSFIYLYFCMTFSSYTRFIFCSAYQEKFKERERKNWIAQE